MNTPHGPWIFLTFLLTGVVVTLGIVVWWVMATFSNSELLVNEQAEPTNQPQPTSTNSTESTTTSPCPESGACDVDAQVYCPDEWSGKSVEASYKIDLVNCLYDEHKNDISDECFESLDCRQQLNENLLAACEEDKRKFCMGVRPSPGSEPLVDCLGENFAELTPDCATAWTQHDAAKASR